MNLKQEDVELAEKVAKNQKINVDTVARLADLHFYLKALLEKVDDDESNGARLPTTKLIFKHLLAKVDEAWNESSEYKDFYKN